MEDEDDFKGLWERVISPTIQMKYVTVRCNLNNEVRKAEILKSGGQLGLVFSSSWFSLFLGLREVLSSSLLFLRVD